MKQAAVDSGAVANPQLSSAIRSFLAGGDYFGIAVRSLIWEAKKRGVDASRHEVLALAETGLPGYRVSFDGDGDCLTFARVERTQPHPESQRLGVRAQALPVELRIQSAAPSPKAQPVATPPPPPPRREVAPAALQEEALRIKAVLDKAGTPISLSEAFTIAQSKFDGTALSNPYVLGRLAQVYMAEREALGLKCRASEAVEAVQKSLGAAGSAT